LEGFHSPVLYNGVFDVDKRVKETSEW